MQDDAPGEGLVLAGAVSGLVEDLGGFGVGVVVEESGVRCTLTVAAERQPQHRRSVFGVAAEFES